MLIDLLESSKVFGLCRLGNCTYYTIIFRCFNFLLNILFNVCQVPV